jgi:hypothetical protein
MLEARPGHGTYGRILAGDIRNARTDEDFRFGRCLIGDVRGTALSTLHVMSEALHSQPGLARRLALAVVTCWCHCSRWRMRRPLRPHVEWPIEGAWTP